jgi:hypothetical protein
MQPEPSMPLLNLPCIALQHILRGELDQAEEQMHLLTRSELQSLVPAAEALAALAARTGRTFWGADFDAGLAAVRATRRTVADA